MLPSTESLPLSELLGYRKLALAVIARALRDFAGLDYGDHTADTHTIAKRLSRVRRQISAGRFLFERRDRLTALWWRLAGRHGDSRRALRIVVVEPTEDSPGLVIEDRIAHLAKLEALEQELMRARDAERLPALMRRTA